MVQLSFGLCQKVILIAASNPAPNELPWRQWLASLHEGPRINPRGLVVAATSPNGPLAIGGHQFIDEDIEDARNSVAGINGEYGQASSFANSCGLIFQKEAAGVVEAMGPQVQVTSGDISVVYQGDVILGRLAMGADFLNPAACVELYAGTATAPAAFGSTYPENKA